MKKITLTEDSDNKKPSPRVKGIQDLPSAIIHEILSRLAIPTLFETRYVCHDWRSLINTPHLANLHFTRACHDRTRVTGLIIQSIEEFYKPKEICCLPDIHTPNKTLNLNNMPFKSSTIRLVGSVNGLLCFASSDALLGSCCNYKCIFICNPVTGDYFLMPECSTSFSGFKNGCGFGFDSKHNEYKVVKLGTSPTGLGAEVCRVGGPKSSWRPVTTHRTTSKSVKFRSCDTYFGALFNDALHWLVMCQEEEVDYYTYMIAAISLVDEQVRYIVPPPPYTSLETNDKLNKDLYVGELGGQFVMVDYSRKKPNEHVHVWLMKEYDDIDNGNPSWSKDLVINWPVQTDQLFKENKSFHPLCIQEDGQILLEYCFRRLKKPFTQQILIQHDGIESLNPLYFAQFFEDESEGDGKCVHRRVYSRHDPKHTKLLLYDPKSRSFNDLNITGLPIAFTAVPYQPTLVPLKCKLDDDDKENFQRRMDKLFPEPELVKGTHIPVDDDDDGDSSA